MVIGIALGVILVIVSVGVYSVGYDAGYKRAKKDDFEKVKE